MYTYCIYNVCVCVYIYIYIFYRSIYPVVVQSYTIYNEVVKPLIPRKCTVFNGNFVFDLYDIFHECNPG